MLKNDIQIDADTLLKIPVEFSVRFPLLPAPSVATVVVRMLRRVFSSRPGRLKVMGVEGWVVSRGSC